MLNIIRDIENFKLYVIIKKSKIKKRFLTGSKNKWKKLKK